MTENPKSNAGFILKVPVVIGDRRREFNYACALSGSVAVWDPHNFGDRSK